MYASNPERSSRVAEKLLHAWSACTGKASYIDAVLTAIEENMVVVAMQDEQNAKVVEKREAWMR